MANPNKQDPNKYAKNKDIKAESGANNIIAIVSFILIIIGLVGLGMEFFKEGGWLGKATSWLFQDTTHMAFIPVIGVAGWLLNMWMTSTSKGEVKKTGNLPMFVMMGLGLYYIYRFVTTGAF